MTEVGGPGGPGPHEQHMLAANAAAEAAQFAGVATAVLDRPAEAVQMSDGEELAKQQVDSFLSQADKSYQSTKVDNYLSNADQKYQEAKEKPHDPADHVLDQEQVLGLLNDVHTLHGHSGTDKDRERILASHGISAKRDWSKGKGQHEREMKDSVHKVVQTIDERLQKSIKARDDLARRNEGAAALQRGREAHDKMNQELEKGRQDKANAKEFERRQESRNRQAELREKREERQAELEQEKAAWKERIGVGATKSDVSPTVKPEDNAFEKDDTKGDRSYGKWLKDGGQLGADRRKDIMDAPLPKRRSVSSADELDSIRGNHLTDLKKSVNQGDLFDFDEHGGIEDDPKGADEIDHSLYKIPGVGNGNVDPSKPYDYEQESGSGWDTEIMSLEEMLQGQRSDIQKEIDEARAEGDEDRANELALELLGVERRIKANNFSDEPKTEDEPREEGIGWRLVGKKVHGDLPGGSSDEDDGGADAAPRGTRSFDYLDSDLFKDDDEYLRDMLDDTADESTRQGKWSQRFGKVRDFVGDSTRWAVSNVAWAGEKGWDKIGKFLNHPEKARRNRLTVAGAGVLAVGAGIGLAIWKSRQGIESQGGGDAKQKLLELLGSKEKAKSFRDYLDWTADFKASHPVLEGGITTENNPALYDFMMNEQLGAALRALEEAEKSQVANAISGSI